jgi:very-short-patch-repair endonuclease
MGEVRWGCLLKKHLTISARKLRRNATEAEKLLWERLRGRRIEGVKFRRQQPIGPYVVDFVSFEKKLIIELDGGQHKIQKNEDEKREKWFEQRGFRIFRFWNCDIFENFEGVLERVRKMVLKPPAPLAKGFDRSTI